jgi:hypothetical protein
MAAFPVPDAEDSKEIGMAELANPSLGQATKE